MNKRRTADVVDIALCLVSVMVFVNSPLFARSHTTEDPELELGD